MCITYHPHCTKMVQKSGIVFHEPSTNDRSGNHFHPHSTKVNKSGTTFTHTVQRSTKVVPLPPTRYKGQQKWCIVMLLEIYLLATMTWLRFSSIMAVPLFCWFYEDTQLERKKRRNGDFGILTHCQVECEAISLNYLMNSGHILIY